MKMVVVSFQLVQDDGLARDRQAIIHPRLDPIPTATLVAHRMAA